MTLCITMVAAFCLGHSGMIAYVAGESQADLRLTLLDIESRTTKSVGQGDRDAFPQWSPDGERLAYQSKQPDGLGVRVVSADGSDDRPLPHRFDWNYRPRWSPKGGKLAYSTDGETFPLQAIAVYDFETDAETLWGGGHRGLMQPVWLPTTDLMKALDPDDQSAAEALGLYELQAEAEEHGVLIAVGLIGEPPRVRTEVFIVTRSHAVPLLPFLIPDSHRYVKWNAIPDDKGRQIAYESNEGGDRELFVLGRRGVTNVSNHPAADWNPVWSPDGGWLAFESFREGRRGMYRVLVSTANVLPIAADASHDYWSPDWSPDGKWLVFVSDRTGDPQLFITRPDGTDMEQLTDGDFMALAPVWRPANRDAGAQ